VMLFMTAWAGVGKWMGNDDIPWLSNVITTALSGPTAVRPKSTGP
jgi:hypothetical protein